MRIIFWRLVQSWLRLRLGRPALPRRSSGERRQNACVARNWSRPGDTICCRRTGIWCTYRLPADLPSCSCLRTGRFDRIFRSGSETIWNPNDKSFNSLWKKAGLSASRATTHTSSWRMKSRASRVNGGCLCSEAELIRHAVSFWTFRVWGGHEVTEPSFAASPNEDEKALAGRDDVASPKA